MTKLRKCAICGNEIEGKGKKLADGSVVCLDCYFTGVSSQKDSSAEVIWCETCDRAVLARNVVRDDRGVYCLVCYRKEIEEMVAKMLADNGPLWEDWVEKRIEELKDPNKWTAFRAHGMEAMELLTQDKTRIGKRIDKRIAFEILDTILDSLSKSWKRIGAETLEAVLAAKKLGGAA